jgi:sulfur carrier protein ThiS
VLGERCEIELELPASVQEILRSAAAEKPPASAQLLRGGEPVPAVWRAGTRLAPGDAVSSGDVLELVTAISGG